MTRGTTSAWVQAMVCATGLVALHCRQGSLFTGVEGHAYMILPVSRNFWYTPVFQESGFPEMEFCPHCMQSKGPANVRARAEANTDPTELEIYGGGRWPHYDSYERGELLPNGNYFETDAISVRHGLCGDPGQTQPEGTNTYAQDNSVYPVLETLEEGSVMEMKVVMSTYHWGHLEFFICNADDLPDGPDSPVTQSCFNKYPLDRAADDGDASPIDPNHPGRYYVDPPCRAAETDQTKPPGTGSGDVVTARYQLPAGLTCERCIIQMVYYTGNSCFHPGYEEFNPPSWPSECAPDKEDWITMDPGMCGRGDKYPEEFWNCADVAIMSGGGGGSPRPTPEPAPAPTPEPEPTAPEATPAPEFMPIEIEYPPSYYTSSHTASTDDDTDGDDEVDEATMPSTDDGTEEEPTPAPTPAPSVEPAEPLNEPEPVTSTLMPATFAPIQPVENDDPECDGVEAEPDFGQCGGTDYEGSGCCAMGYVCEELTDCYSECRPSMESCSEGWGQCGGREWDGPTCCGEGGECVERNEWYSQCIPATGN